MANALYPAFKQALLTAGLDVESDDIRVVLLDSGYTYSSAHDNLDDVTAGTRVATSSALGSKTITNGTFDSADVTFSALTGDAVVACLLYQHTGTESTSKLIAYFDTGITGFPFTPSGADYTLRVNASGWFSL